MQGGSVYYQAAPGEQVLQSLPLIIFDFDGTIADSMGLCLEELIQTYQALGLPVPQRFILEKCNGPSHEEAAVLLGLPEELQGQFCRIRGEMQMSILPLWQRAFPGIPQVLSALSERAYLAIASNGRLEYIKQSLGILNMAQNFTYVMGQIPGQNKEVLVRQIMDRAGPCRAMMVGDKMGDILAGRENGLYTVAACYGYGSEEEWAEADRKAATVDELYRICLDFCRG